VVRGAISIAIAIVITAVISIFGDGFKMVTNNQLTYEKIEAPFFWGMTKPYNHYGGSIF